jgi:hypothetical protein
LGLLLTWLKTFKLDEPIAYIWEHPIELVSPLTITLLLIFLVFAVWKLITTTRVLKDFGVRLFSKHSTDDEKAADWRLLQADLLDASDAGSELWIMGATGKATFASGAAPLCDTLRTYKGAIRILLMHPFAQAFERRTRDLKHDQESFADEILDALDYCASLVHKYGRDVQVRLYRETAIWKMFVTPNHLWLQHYNSGRHVDDTPMYCFQSVPGGSSLYEALKAVFFKRWNYDNPTIVDLTRWNRSQSATREYWVALIG